MEIGQRRGKEGGTGQELLSEQAKQGWTRRKWRADGGGATGV